MSAGGGAGAARLPPELLDALMRLLDREDLLPAAAVCWAWREAGHRRARRALLHHSQDSAVLESWGLVRADHRMRETHCRCLPIYLHHIPLTLTRAELITEEVLPFDAGFNDDGEWFHDSCFATDSKVFLVRTNRKNTELVVYLRDQDGGEPEVMISRPRETEIVLFGCQDSKSMLVQEFSDDETSEDKLSLWTAESQLIKDNINWELMERTKDLYPDYEVFEGLDDAAVSRDKIAVTIPIFNEETRKDVILVWKYDINSETPLVFLTPILNINEKEAKLMLSPACVCLNDRYFVQARSWYQEDHKHKCVAEVFQVDNFEKKSKSIDLYEYPQDNLEAWETDNETLQLEPGASNKLAVWIHILKTLKIVDLLTGNLLYFFNQDMAEIPSTSELISGNWVLGNFTLLSYSSNATCEMIGRQVTIENCPEEMHLIDILKEVEKFGVGTEFHNNRQGTAYLKFTTPGEAAACVAELNNTVVGGNVVQMSLPAAKQREAQVLLVTENMNDLAREHHILQGNTVPIKYGGEWSQVKLDAVGMVLLSEHSCNLYQWIN